MAKDPEIAAHQQWLGYVQPVGLLVSAPALVNAQAFLNRNIVPDHQRFLECISPIDVADGEDSVAAVTDLPRLLREVFQWDARDLVGAPGADPAPPSLEVALPEYGETLRPTYAVRALDPHDDGTLPWIMLVQVIPVGTDLDAVVEHEAHRWQASPQARFERLLRENQIPIGLLSNGTQMRLVYAPRGETSGYATFGVEAMSEVAGRPIFAALHMLLSAERVFIGPAKLRLPAILAESRKYQSVVSTQLAEQVLAALYELLRGFQAADDHRRGELLRTVLQEDPNHVYGGLLTVLMRLVFTLYAEDRGLMPTDGLYVNHYSVTGLFERLREDAGRYSDTMDQRFGAWTRLLTLFRLIHDGGGHDFLRLPPRHGHLFNPDRYNFLEGRPWTVGRVIGDRIDPPMISDGVVYRVLEKLMVLDGERLSYRTLDVEQIGSVYETIMGFTLERATGRSIAVKPVKPHGAPATINLDELLTVGEAARPKWLREHSGQTLTGEPLNALKAAASPEAVVVALGGKVAREATPSIMPTGAMILQPSNERRRSGSHYTPRSLTEPIVRIALGPVLDRLGPLPTPEQILDLKICDPAMGSGAFLVQACRQLGDALVEAWHAHDCVPRIPLDEDEVLHARRLVAQRCLYGVDKNPLAADLAKLSLWLTTLARDHPFTFLDHALRHGDSLVGLTRKQLAAFHWESEAQGVFSSALVDTRVRQALDLRAQIRSAADDASETSLRILLREADDALADVRLVGDLVIAAFFASDKPKVRDVARRELSTKVQDWLSTRDDFNELRGLADGMREGDRPVVPFHWEVEFPEVFDREKPGFDAIVGNPPFAGGRKISENCGETYAELLQTLQAEISGGADLIAHFFRRSFSVLRECGCFGLIATNTIAQGDTRASGLRWICTHGGTIYAARKRLKWPGNAAVVVSVLHIHKGELPGPFDLDGTKVPVITAYLFHAGGHEDPAKLLANTNKSFQGSIILGMGFTFDDTDKKGVASPIADMHRLIAKDPRNTERIFPYIGGEEVNESPTHAHRRYAINFGEMTEEEAQRWPDLWAIVEEKVKPERITKDAKKYPRMVNEWWKYWNQRVELHEATRGLERILAISRIGNAFAFAFLPARQVINEKIVVFPFDHYGFFALLQSRAHEVWARFFSSTLKDDLQYTPSRCFETFPFPDGFDTNSVLREVGRVYHEFRAALMVKNDEGLTKTYNRFHDPEERSPEICTLRELHAAMDRAMLDAYGWTDLQPTCDFLLDYEEDEDEDGQGMGVGRRKKPWRYRWSDDLHDEVLTRLLGLNRHRAGEERLRGAAAEASGAVAGRRRLARGRRALTSEPLPFARE